MFLFVEWEKRCQYYALASRKVMLDALNDFCETKGRYAW